MLHRITFVNEDGSPGWVDIKPLTFGMRLEARDAANQGFHAWGVARMALYVDAWSLPGSPRDAEYVAGLENNLATYILNQAEAHFEEVARTSEERFRAAATAGGGDGA